MPALGSPEAVAHDRLLVAEFVGSRLRQEADRRPSGRACEGRLTATST